MQPLGPMVAAAAVGPMVAAAWEVVHARASAVPAAMLVLAGCVAVQSAAANWAAAGRSFDETAETSLHGCWQVAAVAASQHAAELRRFHQCPAQQSGMQTAVAPVC